MTRHIAVVPIEIAVGRIELKIREPGKVRHVAWNQKPRLVMQRGDAGFEEVPVIFVEACKEMPIVGRRYHVIEQGQEVDIEPGERAEWQGTGVSSKGKVVHVFEVVGEATEL